MASRSAASRSHGSSARKRSATSYVAPPQHSTREQLGRGPRDVRGDRQQVLVRTRVASSDWWASRKVVSVTATRRPRAQASGEALRARARAAAAGNPAARVAEVDPGGQLDRRVEPASAPVAVRLVDGDLGQPGQQLGAAVGRRARAVSSSGRSSMNDVVTPPATEVGVVEHGLQERDVRGHAADPELGQRPPRPARPRSAKSGRGRSA